jgi:predicted MFS family arabinose efflux permease
LSRFGDRTYSVAIITIFAVLFANYGMLLVITQYLQNVRGFSPIDAGLLLFPFSVSMMIVSLTAGKLVGVVGSRRLILLGRWK